MHCYSVPIEGRVKIEQDVAERTEIAMANIGAATTTIVANANGRAQALG